MEREKNIQQIKKISLILACIYLLYWLVTAIFYSKSQDPNLPKVIVQKPKLMTITNYVTQTGTTVAYNSVDLVARIEGYLEGIHFTDGTFVKKGQELFIVEPQPYFEKLKSAKASVTIQQATYAYDKAEYARQKRMYQQNATSLNNVEKWQAKAEASLAQITKAQADEAIAAINYSYTHILAPFDGRIGRHLVDIGNLVGHGEATNLATIEQLDPIYVYFNLNELDLIKIRQIAREHRFKPSDINQIPVDVGMQNETGFPHKGTLNFVNTGLNASTGTMEFRALLPNKNYALLPGLFVQIRIPIGSPKPELTVPEAAVQYDQIGPYLLIADEQQVIALKRIAIGASENGYRTILKGVKPTDNVVVSGLQNAIPGKTVALVSSEGAQQ